LRFRRLAMREVRLNEKQQAYPMNPRP
jgi:hypothetical protein